MKKKKDNKKKVKYRRKELLEKSAKDCELSYSEEERGRERKER